MLNLKLVEDQQHWRVAVVATFAKIMGVLIHVEGIPFGSNRTRRHKTGEGLAGQTSGQVGQIGSAKAQEKETLRA